MSKWWHFVSCFLLCLLVVVKIVDASDDHNVPFLHYWTHHREDVNKMVSNIQMLIGDKFSSSSRKPGFFQLSKIAKNLLTGDQIVSEHDKDLMVRFFLSACASKCGKQLQRITNPGVIHSIVKLIEKRHKDWLNYLNYLEEMS